MRAALLSGGIVLAGLLVLAFRSGSAGGARDVAPLPRGTEPTRGPVVQAPPAVHALREIFRADASPVAVPAAAAAPTVHGRVVDAHGGPALAEVALVEDVGAFGASPARYVQSLAASSFEFRPERAGRYWILARGPEGVSRAWLDLDPRRPEGQALVVQLEGGGRVSGTLSDAEGRPLADWPLAFRLAGSRHEGDPRLALDVPAVDDDYDGPGRTWAFATTDPVGRFDVRGLRPGSWSIRTSRVGDERRGGYVLAHAVAADVRPLRLVLPVHRLQVGLVDERRAALAFQPSEPEEFSGLRLWRVQPDGWHRVTTAWRPTGRAHVWETFLEPDVLHAATFGSGTRPLVYSDPIAPAERGTSEIELRAVAHLPSARVRVRLPEGLAEAERELVAVTLLDARHGVPVAAEFFLVHARRGEIELGPLAPGVYDLSVGGVTRLWPAYRRGLDPEAVAPSLWETRVVLPPRAVAEFLAPVEPRGELRMTIVDATARLERLGDARVEVWSPRRVGGHWRFDDLRPGLWRLTLRHGDGASTERDVEILRSRVTTISAAR